MNTIQITLTTPELHALMEFLGQRGLMERAKVEEQGAPAGLSAREVAILRLIAEGVDNQGIADRLCVTRDRARQVISEIYYKLGASNRAHAVAITMRQNILLRGSA